MVKDAARVENKICATPHASQHLFLVMKDLSMNPIRINLRTKFRTYGFSLLRIEHWVPSFWTTGPWHELFCVLSKTLEKFDQHARQRARFDASFDIGHRGCAVQSRGAHRGVAHRPGRQRFGDLAFCDRFRSIQRFNLTRKIFETVLITGQDDCDLRARASRIPNCVYLPKPFFGTVLLAAVRSLIERFKLR